MISHFNHLLFRYNTLYLTDDFVFQSSFVLLGSPWWIRTTGCQDQNLMPYRLANGLNNFYFFHFSIIFVSVQLLLKLNDDFCFNLVGPVGFEPTTNRLKVYCSTDWAKDPSFGGKAGNRTLTSEFKGRRSNRWATFPYFIAFLGARGRTRTDTSFDTGFWIQRVYQFHHSGITLLQLLFQSSLFCCFLMWVILHQFSIN